jgi:ubiquinone biosynthesis protein UbiJ
MHPKNAINLTFHTAAIAALETLVNKALLLDLSTKNSLTSLENHVFLFHCNDPELSLYVIPGYNEIRLCGFFEGEANTSLTGSFGEFINLAKADDPANALINGNLELHGDSNALMTLQTIAKNLEIDWELPLSRLFGNVIGHQLGRGLRQSFRFGSQAIKGIKRQLDDFLVEESDLIAPNWQIEKFFRDIDQLALRTERVEAKLKKYRLSQSSLLQD